MADLPMPLQSYGLWAVGATLALLLAFIGLRGRVPIDRGWGGMTIRRFGVFERLCHWVLALSFLALATTGLAQLYGALLLPLLGTQALATFLSTGRPLHNIMAAVFAAALALTFLMRLVHSLPGWRDAVWLAKAGGMLVKGSTPPAWRFNAGQKIFFWLVVLGGAGLVLTGFALLFPYRTGLVSKTFAMLAAAGVQLPSDATNLTPAQEVHYARLWHGVLAVALVCAVMVHVTMRTIGIQGALSAMVSGRMDVNLARQQHSLWAVRELERMEEDAVGSVSSKPAAAE